jgi:hypothetical protein
MISDSIAHLQRTKLEQARQMSPDEKLLAGGKIFDELIVRMIAGIKSQFPAFSNEEIHRELRRRLEINELLEADRGPK